MYTILNLHLSQATRVGVEGASNTSGQINGVQAKLKERSDTLYVQCRSHAVNLVSQEAARNMKLIPNALKFVQGVSVVIRESRK